MITSKINQNELAINVDDSFVLTLYEEGSVVTIDSASFVLYDSSGNEKDSGSITPSDNTLTVSVSADTFSVVQENCRIEWTFTISSVERKINTFFDVVKWKIYNNVIDSDLKKYFPDLTDSLWTGETNFSDQINKAFEYVKIDIKNKGRRPYLIVNNDAVKQLIELRALSLVFLGFSREIDDNWIVKSKDFMSVYSDRFDSTVFKYDDDQSGTIDSETSFNSIRVKR